MERICPLHPSQKYDTDTEDCEDCLIEDERRADACDHHSRSGEKLNAYGNPEYEDRVWEG